MGDVEAILKAAAKAGFTDENKIRSILKSSKYASKLKKAKRYATNTLDIQNVPLLIVVEKNGQLRKLEEATEILTVEGFQDLLERTL